MALKKMKENLDRVLDKNLQDLVRGIRNHKEEEAKFISECLDEIKNELKSGDLVAKSNAVSKLLYLQMLGYEISWAAFNIIEVMSSTKFTQKRTGYLVGSQSFHVGTDVLMLATNMIRKDLSSGNLYDAGVALSGLSCFTTPDLAQDLAQDIMSLMTSIRPYLRKKSVLLMYKVYLNYPDALRPSFARLKERLEDQDQGVQSAAVNVICELARKNPKNYLSLAPTFFKLMTTSTNNWMLIKIIKLFGALTPLEPRLGKKLIEPLTNLIHSTSAMSLLYECINTVIAVLVSISSDLPNHSQSVQLCVQKLRVLIEDSDQNLKYLGLLAFSKILKTHPKSVQAHKDLVLSCLDDRDESIRMRALDLLHGMVSKKNLMEIVRKLMIHMEKAEGTYYRDELMSKIIEICSQNNYQHVVNFEWYISVLIELTKMKATSHGQVLASQMMDVAIRVSAIRKFAVGQMAILVENAHMFTSNSQKSGICEVLYAAVWICGEFSELLVDPQATLRAMFNSKITSLPGHVQAVYVQNITKLYSTILVKAELENNTELIREVGQLLSNKLPMFIQSSDLEVQERACSALQLIKYITKLLDKGVNVGEEVSFLFRGDLNPVAAKAQKKVPVPEGLDLDKWINHAPSKPVDMSKKKSIFNKDHVEEPTAKTRKAKEVSAEEIKRQREARLQAQDANPHYLKLGASKKQPLASQSPAEVELIVEEIPIENLSLTVELKTSSGLQGLASADKYYRQAQEQQKKKKKEKRRKDRGADGKKRKRDRVESEEPEPGVQHTVSSVVEMPDGAADNSDDDRNTTDKFKALDINLDEPLRDDERLPVRQHRTDAHALPDPVDNSKLSTDGKKKKKKSKNTTDRKSKKSKTRTESLGEMPVDDQPSTSHPELTTPTDMKQDEELKLVNGDNTTSTKKKKKTDKSKKKSKSKKDKAEYEQPNDSGEATGSATLDLSSLNLNYVRRVAEDGSIRMEMEPRVSQQDANSVKVQMYFASLSDKQIQSMEFNILDTENSQLIRKSADEPIKLEFELAVNSHREQEFSFNVTDITNPVRMKGTLSYVLKDDDSSSHKALDFELELLCRDFLVSQPCTTETFTQLLTSGDLVRKSSRRVQTNDNLTALLAKICFYGHLYVVESVENSASLYTSSIQNHHICLLVKKLTDTEVSIDGKAADLTYLDSVLDELSTTI